MKIASKLIVLALLAGISPVHAQTVELTGFANLFGEKIALLVLHQPVQAASVNFTLSEGESQYGVKLLAVDEPNHRVQIEQADGQQYVHLCAAADLTAPVPAVEPSGQPHAGRTLTPQEQLELDQF